MTDADRPRHIERGPWTRTGGIIRDHTGTVIAVTPRDDDAQRLVTAHNRDVEHLERWLAAADEDRARLDADNTRMRRQLHTINEDRAALLAAMVGKGTNE